MQTHSKLPQKDKVPTLPPLFNSVSKEYFKRNPTDEQNTISLHSLIKPTTLFIITSSHLVSSSIPAIIAIASYLIQAICSSAVR